MTDYISKNFTNPDTCYTTESMIRRFYNLCDKVPKIFDRDGPIYHTWIRFQVGSQNNSKSVVFNTDSTNPYENLITNLSVTKSGSNTANTFTLNVYYDPFNHGQETKNQIEKLENRKIWLKCGGFITIDKTEALTAIDVNTGKYTGNKNAEDTIFKVNKEATLEIAKQIRLRDIGGIIIIDYIDIPKEWTRGDKKFYALKISGDSMFPKYSENDIVIFEQNDDKELYNGKDCAVMINGTESTFKKVLLNEQGIVLQPYNTAYDIMMYSNEQIEQLPIKVVGIAREKRTKL